MSQKQLDENKLLELLELAKIAEQKMRESNEGLTALAEKWQSRAKVMLEKVQKHISGKHLNLAAKRANRRRGIS